MKLMGVVGMVSWFLTGWISYAGSPGVKVGASAPALEFKDVHVGDERKNFSLKDLEGNVVILEYWGPFCGPCIKAFPHINKLVETFKGEPVRFISIADQGYEGCKRVLDKKPLHTWQVFDVGLFDPFGVEAMPRTIIIDKHGRVAAYTRPNELNEAVIRKALDGKSLKSHYKRSEFK